MKKNVGILLCLIVSLCQSALFAWTNPMELPGLEDRSLGDPYIMKYKGYYYLYVSAGDTEIYCWKSKDLVDWSEPYICCTDPVTAVAYAPEVIYWNGTFYMCTSPRGGGHYMLTSDSPTGPFTHQSGNLGRDIDGSMFVDDDGKWYFYHANNEGIRGCEMPTHLSFGDDVDLGCCISGQWTEGPCVFKRNGLYYLIYTGNHVWTNGYRIDYAVSEKGPLEGFNPRKDQNPILVDTETPTHKALGHGTAFVGPDLDSYYFCYHNLQDNKARRLLNFERIGWSGNKLIMTGPSFWEQDPPILAECDFFERSVPGEGWKMLGGKWRITPEFNLVQNSSKGNGVALFNNEPYENFTAEFTVRTSGASVGKAGAIFSYADPRNYSEALINAADTTFEVRSIRNGKIFLERQFSLPEDFDPTAWHSIRIEKTGTRLRAYIDGMRKLAEDTEISGGSVGYATRNGTGEFSYIAVSPYVDGNGILDVSLPVPGLIDADFRQAGDKPVYKINVRADDFYNLGIRYKGKGSKINILEDGVVIAADLQLPPTDSISRIFTVENIPLRAGHHELLFEIEDGNPSLQEFIFRPSVLYPHNFSDSFDAVVSPGWGYREGVWNVVDGKLESSGRYGKMLAGSFDDIHLTDYTVECDICYLGDGMNGGLLFRTTNPSTGGADDNPQLGSDFLQGYFFMAGPDSATLGKHNFGWQPLATVPIAVDASMPHHFKVEVKGDTFRCYLDDMDSPVITYTDNNPFITGRAGFRVHDSVIRFDNFSLSPVVTGE